MKAFNHDAVLDAGQRRTMARFRSAPPALQLPDMIGT
jgi:hypothetical protein